MKKFKSYLVALVAIVSCFALTGVVKADSTAGTATDFRIICNPDEVSKSESTNCYVVASIKNGKIFAVLGNIVTLDKLEIVGDASERGKDGVYGSNDNVFGQYLSNKQVSATLDKAGKGLTCSSALGCVTWISKNQTASIVPSDDSGAITTGLGSASEYKGFTQIGHVSVKLAADVTDSDCGQICISFEPKPSETFTEATDSGSANKACDKVQVKIANAAGSTTNTGNFASYAVLAAGAFIAISAIAIAKKHNKFYRV